MNEDNFNFDKYFSNASWKDILEKSPFLKENRLPTIILKEKRLVYISSQDDYCSIDNADAMIDLSHRTKLTYGTSVLKRDYAKAAIAKCDYETLHGLLFALDHHIDPTIE